VSTIVPGGLFVTADEAAWLVRALAERRLENGQPAGLLASLRKAAAGASNPPPSTASVWMEALQRRMAGQPRRQDPRSGPPPRSAFTDPGDK
jgi:hypothetical protein